MRNVKQVLFWHNTLEGIPGLSSELLCIEKGNGVIELRQLLLL
jgi:hypothetical protein